MATQTLKQKIDQGYTKAFRQELLKRWMDGDHFAIGDYRLFIAGPSVSERKVKPADYRAVSSERKVRDAVV